MYGVDDLVVNDPVCTFVGMVTAEMFQSKQRTDVMSKMVEDLDEVSYVKCI